MKQEIGEGAFGTVYKGYWRSVECAIKKINISSADRVDFETMLREASIQSKLHHPHIVSFYGINIGENDIWVV